MNNIKKALVMVAGGFIGPAGVYIAAMVDQRDPDSAASNAGDGDP